MKQEIGLIHYDEIEGFIRKIGCIDDLKAGKLYCHSCNEVITFLNFRAAFKEKGRLFFMCRKETCLKKPEPLDE